MTATILFANNANSTLAGAISSSAVTASLASGTGALFPAPSGGNYFVATLSDVATGLLREIVWVTARTGDTVTMVRGQEGTTALNWNAGDFFINQWTAGQAAYMLQSGSVTTGVLTFNGRSGTVTLGSSDVTSALGYTPASTSALISPTALTPGAKNVLGIQTSSGGSTSTWSVSSAIIPSTTPTNNPFVVGSVSATLTVATSVGLNGLDSGTAAVNTWYWVFLISNGSTTGFLASTSQSSPTLPSGYTYVLLIGAIKTDGSANTHQFMQAGLNWDYISPSMQAVTSGSMSGWQEIVLTAFLPPASAVRVRGTLYNTNASVNGSVAPINPGTNTPGHQWVSGGSNGGADYFSLQYDMPLVTQSLWYESNGANSVWLAGFLLSI